MLTVYHHPLSSASRYVRLILGEYGLQAEFKEERPWQRRDDFLRLNPAGTLPVMVDEGGQSICGGIASGEYLDETAGVMAREKRLMPENPIDRAETRRIVEWFLVKFEEEVVRYLIGERVEKQLMRAEEGGGAPDSAVIRAGRTNLRHHLSYTGWLASRRNWLGGNRITQADMAAAAAFSVLDYLGEVDWDRESAARDWYQRMKSRPAFRPLLADKVPGITPAAHYIDLDF